MRFAFIPIFSTDVDALGRCRTACGLEHYLVYGKTDPRKLVPTKAILIII